MQEIQELRRQQEDERKRRVMRRDNLTEEELKLMAHKCAVGVGGAKGSAKLLDEEAMLAIYRASM